MSDPSDPSGQTLTELLSVELVEDGRPCVWRRTTLTGPTDAQLREAAALIAHAAVAARLPSTDLLDLWQARVAGGPPLSARDHGRIEPYLVTGFGPSLPPDHIQGYVAEWIWFILTREAVEEGRTALRIEPPGASATSQGGDGLCIYEDADGLRSFRLWEIKKHDQAGGVSPTVRGAYQQLSSRAVRYLAQYSTVGAEREDELAEFYASLTTLWVDADPACGVGVAVGCSERHVPSRCFSTMAQYFTSLANDGQLEGLVAGVSNYADFAASVRDMVWSGL